MSLSFQFLPKRLSEAKEDRRQWDMFVSVSNMRRKYKTGNLPLPIHVNTSEDDIHVDSKSSPTVLSVVLSSLV